MGDKDYKDNVNPSGYTAGFPNSVFYDCSLAPANSVSGSFVPPVPILDLVSSTDMTGSVPSMYPRPDFPDYDNFTNLGMKS